MRKSCSAAAAFIRRTFSFALATTDAAREPMQLRGGAKQDGVLPTPYHIPGGFKNPSTASRRFLLERAHNQSLGLPVSARGWIAAGGFGGTMCRAFTSARALPVDGLDITAMATREELLRTAFAASSLWGGNSSSRENIGGRRGSSCR